LARLVEAGVLATLPRRVGGNGGGSGQYVYQVGPIGAGLLKASSSAAWHEAPSVRFVEHTLAGSEIHVALVEAERGGKVEGLTIVHEPRTWRRFTSTGGQIEVLKPDLMVELATPDGWELRWWVEVDRGTEHIPTVVRKCQVYARYWRSGVEAQHHEVFPRILYSVPDKGRAAKITATIGRTRTLPRDLFRVATTDDTVATLTKPGDEK
jgi:hypothetical protein